jgi:NADH-quinone oxidoreductase subunit L
MTVPLIVLAALSVLGGFMLAGNWIVDFLTPVVGHAEHEELGIPALLLTVFVVLTVAAGVALAWYTIGRTDVPRMAPADVSPFTKASRADLYGDAINDVLVVKPSTDLVSALTTFDRTVVDGVVMGQAAATGGMSMRFRRLQSGFVRSYALSLLGGAAIVVLALLVVNW